MEPRLYTITQLTQEFGITTRTLRFYEAQGLITPQRRGRQRLYQPADRTRLKLILRGKRLGFSLQEIAEIFYNAPGDKGGISFMSARQQKEDQMLNRIKGIFAGAVRESGEDPARRPQP